MAIYDENGFNIPRFNELNEIIEADQDTNIGQKFVYQNNKLIYQLNSVTARLVDLLGQGVQGAFDTLKLGSAEGTHLEEIGRLRNVFRIPAGRSNTNSQYVRADPGTIIPAGSLFYSSTSQVEAYNPTQVTVSASSCAEALVNTNSTIVVGAVYGLSINGTNYTYTALGGDTSTDVHAALALEFDADTGKTWTYLDALSGSDRYFTITADTDTLISITSLTTKMVVGFLKVRFYVECVETGPISVDLDFMDSLRSPVAGVSLTNNDEAYILGRDEETDAELRGRIEAGPVDNYAGTVPSIEASMLANVDNVILARAIENTNTSPVDADGRPIHSFELLVDGGIPQEIGDHLWKVKPAGIETVGNTMVTVKDSGNEDRFVFFSTPTSVSIDVEVDYVLYDEESFPADGNVAIQQAVVDYINSLSIGVDVIAGRLFPPVYSAVDGVGTLVIRIQKTSSPGFVTTTIPISVSEFANTTLGQVTVTDVT